MTLFLEGIVRIPVSHNNVVVNGNLKKVTQLNELIRCLDIFSGRSQIS